MKKQFLVAVLCIAIGLFSGCGTAEQTETESVQNETVAETHESASRSVKEEAEKEDTQKPEEAEEEEPPVEESADDTASAAQEPAASDPAPDSAASDADSIIEALSVANYTSQPYEIVNDNVPFFTDADKTTEAFEAYSNLDSRGRCGVAYANICRELMPTEERESISEVKPTGWHNNPYDFVDGGYVYNRCHLIAFELAGENANEKNLITGTRYFNVTGMLPFENMVADYVKETGNHVLYRVTPIYKGDNLVADGVLMEAYSVEDAGDGIEFCVFCYNVQPGVAIDYATGENRADGTVAAQETATAGSDAGSDTGGNGDSGTSSGTYILNTNSKKFHKPDCQFVENMSEKNKKEYTGSRQSVIDQGYSPCGWCNP